MSLPPLDLIIQEHVQVSLEISLYRNITISLHLHQELVLFFVFYL